MCVQLPDATFPAQIGDQKVATFQECEAVRHKVFRRADQGATRAATQLEHTELHRTRNEHPADCALPRHFPVVKGVRHGNRA